MARRDQRGPHRKWDREFEAGSLSAKRAEFGQARYSWCCQTRRGARGPPHPNAARLLGRTLKNSLTRVWGQTGSRPAAPKDLGFASAYLFGAVCPSQGKAAALIMPIWNTAAMNHHLCEISSQVAADAMP